MKNMEVLEKLSNAFGPGGFEEDVIVSVREELSQFQVEVDAMNNVYIRRSAHDGNKPVLMLDAHLDEVGFMVQFVDSKGLISIVPLGGWVPNNLPAHSMVIKNSRGEYIKGIVVSKPPHFMSPKEKASSELTLEGLRIDVGCTSREEVTELFGISAGDPVVPDVQFRREERTGILLGKAFDNRIGCYAVLETLRRLEGLDLPVDVVGALASQEEIGTRGAQVTSQVVKPDMAFVFEGSPADDMYYDAFEAQGVLKKGVQIRHLDQSYISHRGFINLAIEKAKEKDIPFQSAVRRGGGTNAGKIHLSEKAVPVLVLGIPSRYVHTHYSFAAEDDIDAAVNLAVEVIKSLHPERVRELYKSDFLKREKL